MPEEKKEKNGIAGAIARGRKKAKSEIGGAIARRLKKPKEHHFSKYPQALGYMRNAALMVFTHRPNSLWIGLGIIISIVFFSFSYLNWWGQVFANPETVMLPYYILRTMMRMLVAYAFVVAFALPVGIIAGLYVKPRQVILPLLDILQSIPVLGYLPAAIFLFTSSLPNIAGFEFGYEVASVFLIFTGMAWAVTFSIISAVRNIPNDLREASSSFGLRGWAYLRNVVLPAMFPSFITGSILAWGGGWYFLVASELFEYGAKPHALPGLGSYLGNALSKYNNLPSALFGLAVFITVIYIINQVVWKPLRAYSKKYLVQTMISEANVSQEEGSTYEKKGVVVAMYFVFGWFEKAVLEGTGVYNYIMKSRTAKNIFSYMPRKRRSYVMPWYQKGSLYLLLFALLMLAIAYFYSAALLQPLNSLLLTIKTHPELIMLPEFALRSTFRIFIAYIIALVWTLIAAVAVTRSRLLSDIFFPIFDIGQSTPALALFPFIVLVVINFLGGGEPAVEVASIVLLLTGMQWYLLFNIIGAIRQIPGDVLEASRAFGVKGKSFYISILLPAILPGILLGSIQAWGGAWNASIVSEYVQYGNTHYSVSGLGSFLTEQTLAPNPDPWVITFAIAAMTLVVVLLNTFVWKPLFAYSERFKFGV